ncbi:hypothetical protein ACJX0J_029882, partial [Zea mays]
QHAPLEPKALILLFYISDQSFFKKYLISSERIIQGHFDFLFFQVDIWTRSGGWLVAEKAGGLCSVLDIAYSALYPLVFNHFFCSLIISCQYNAHEVVVTKTCFCFIQAGEFSSTPSKPNLMTITSVTVASGFEEGLGMMRQARTRCHDMDSYDIWCMHLWKLFTISGICLQMSGKEIHAHDVVSWNIMIAGFVAHGHGDTALSGGMDWIMILDRMKASGYAPVESHCPEDEVLDELNYVAYTDIPLCYYSSCTRSSCQYNAMLVSNVVLNRLYLNIYDNKLFEKSDRQDTNINLTAQIIADILLNL